MLSGQRESAGVEATAYAGVARSALNASPAEFHHGPEPTVLLVEDDRADAMLVEELVADGAPGLRMTWVRSIEEACAHLSTTRPDCVLLDLHLPDAHGMEALARIHDYTDQVAVVVLTGLDEEETGLAAVAAGAQDYLVKGRVEPELFGRAVRYAIQRKQTERAAVALQASQMQAQENSRLERGLLPTPLLRGAPVADVYTRYRPGRAYALLGGDFYDVVQDADGTVHALIGDVAGHGPDEAAIGVALRLAWRTLVLSGISGSRQLELLEEVLLAERAGNHTFATLTTLVLNPQRRVAHVIRAGHPGMLARSDSGTAWVEVPGGPAIGLLPGRASWSAHEYPMSADTGLVLFTDGLYEGHIGPGNQRLGEDGLYELVASVPRTDPNIFVDALIAKVEAMADEHGGLADDVAVMYLRWARGGGVR